MNAPIDFFRYLLSKFPAGVLVLVCDPVYECPDLTLRQYTHEKKQGSSPPLVS